MLLPVAALPQFRLDMGYPSPDTARVAVAGEVDVATAPMLRDRLLSLLHGQAAAVLVVDLAGCTFLDCTGIGALVSVHNVAARTGRQLRVTHPRPIVRRVLELTGLLDVFAVAIEQPQPVSTRSDPPGMGSVGATVTTSPAMMVAA